MNNGLLFYRTSGHRHNGFNAIMVRMCQFDQKLVKDITSNANPMSYINCFQHMGHTKYLLLLVYSEVSLIVVNWCLQNTAISKTRTKRVCFSYGYKLYNWFEQCKNTNDRCPVPTGWKPAWHCCVCGVSLNLSRTCFSGNNT